VSEPEASGASFYVTGGTLKPGAPSYVERRADTELLESLLAGEFCYILTPRQIGKSSLMARTAKRLEQDGISTAIVDLTQIGTDRGAQAAAQWYFGIANEIHRYLRISEPLRPWWQERLDLPPLQRLTGFFRDLVLSHCPGRVIVFVDEIDSTIGLPFADDFFAALRACFNARATEVTFERLTFVLLGVATPDQLIQDPARTPFNIGRRIDLSDFSPDEAQKLAPGLHADPGEADRRLARILYWTGGHPFLTQALCRAVRERRGRDWEDGTAEQAVDPQVDELFLTSRAQREETNLKHARTRLERPGPEGRRLLKLYARIRQGKSVSDQPTAPHFAQLKLSGVVKATDEGQLALSNHIYEAVFTLEWARSVMPRDRGRQLAAATLAASLMVALVWYALFQPLPYEQSFRAAIEDDGYNGALEAYKALRTNPFSRSQATELMQVFWEQRALRYALAHKRDESLLSTLQGLVFGESEKLRRQARNLVGSDYERLQLVLPRAGEVIAFSPDGAVLAAGPRQEITSVTDLILQRLQRLENRLRGSIEDDQSFATITLTGVRVWDVRSGKSLAPSLPYEKTVTALAFSPDGRSLVTGSADSARLWDVRSGKLLARLRGQKPVMALAFSSDGLTLATGSADNTVRLWDVRSGKLLVRLLVQHSRWTVLALAFSPDGRTLAAGSTDNHTPIWDMRSGKLLARLQTQPTLALAFSADGHILATGSSNSTARLWDARSGKPLAPPLQHQSPVRSVSFSPDGRLLATGSQDNSVRLWDARSGKPLSLLLQLQEPVTELAFSPDGQTLATSSEAYTVRFWDVHTVSPFLRSSWVDQGTVLPGGLSPNGRTIATTSDSRTVRLWDTHTGNSLASPMRNEALITAVAFSSDSRILAIGCEQAFSSRNAARLWDVRTGKLLTPPLQHEEPVTAVAFSPDGRTLATGTGYAYSPDNGARLWDVHTGKLLISPLRHREPITAMAFSPDGRILATAAGYILSEHPVQLWDTRSGKSLIAPLQHRWRVGAMAFSPDGNVLTTGSDDGNASFWDARTGKPLAPTVTVQGPVRTLAFNRNGEAFIVVTDHWLNIFKWDGKQAAPQDSQLLHGFWKAGFRFPSDCERCLQVALDDTGNSFHLETLHLDEPIDPLIEGDSKQLLEKWQHRLALRFDEQMRPVPQ